MGCFSKRTVERANQTQLLFNPAVIVMFSLNSNVFSLSDDDMAWSVIYARVISFFVISLDFILH